VSVPLLRLRSDEQLVALFRAGNDDAFRVIHDRYRARLFAYSRQMLPGSRQDAEDALQDVFVRAYRALRASDRPVSLRAWLYRVAHNRCIDELRRPLPPAPEVLELVRPPGADPLAETERREDLRRLVADVRRLPDQQRSALLMRELNGLTYTEMAGALGVTVPAVKSLLVRARVGLAQAGEARDTACEEIRFDLADAHERGVRATGLARRHLRDCPGCRAYRGELRGASRSLAAFVPGLGPLALLAKLLGLGGGSAAAGSGAAAASAGGGAAAGGALAGGGAIVSSSVVAVAATKVAVVAAVAVATATGVEAVNSGHHHHRHVSQAPAMVAPAPAPAAVGGASAPALPIPHAPAEPAAVPAHVKKPAAKTKHQDRIQSVDDPATATDPTATDPAATDPTGLPLDPTATTDPTTDPQTTDPAATGDPTASTPTTPTLGTGTAPSGTTGTQTGTQVIPESGGASAPPEPPPAGG
jgi:RNA polymerase sigma factor (sigma-70 family)